MHHRALVTGAFGFVGKVLCAQLETEGWSVIRCGIDPPSTDEANFALDIRLPDNCANVLHKAGDITHVFHLAAVAHAGAAHRAPAASFEVNAVGTINLASAVVVEKPSARFIQIGSAAEYGSPQYLPIDEDHPLNPTAPYGISKVAAERYCNFLHTSEGLDAVLLRPFNHTGAEQTEDYVLPAFAKQVTEIEAGLAPPTLHVGNLDVFRDFLHVNDVIDAYIRAGLHAPSGAVYNVCSGRGISIRDALDAMISTIGVDAEVVIDPKRVRAADDPEIYGSHDRLTEATGWTPSTTFDELLADLIAYWRARARPA